MDDEVSELPLFDGDPPRISTWVAAVEARKASLTDPLDIQRVGLLIEHLVAEGDRDVDRTMRTIADSGVYHAWGGNKTSVATKPEQRKLYEAVLEDNPDTFHLYMDIERFFVDVDGVCMDGVLHKEVTAEALRMMGIQPPAGAAESDLFVVSRRQALFVSYADGLMFGEDLYWDEGATVSRLARSTEGYTTEEAR